MPTLMVFENVTLDGYFSRPDGDISWSHTQEQDPEWEEFVASNANGSRERVGVRGADPCRNPASLFVVRVEAGPESVGDEV